MNRVMAVVLLLGAVGTAGAAPSAVTGEWWTPGFNARVRIEPCGDGVCGRIVWLWDDTPIPVVVGALTWMEACKRVVSVPAADGRTRFRRADRAGGAARLQTLEQNPLAMRPQADGAAPRGVLH